MGPAHNKQSRAGQWLETTQNHRRELQLQASKSMHLQHMVRTCTTAAMHCAARASQPPEPGATSGEGIYVSRPLQSWAGTTCTAAEHVHPAACRCSAVPRGAEFGRVCKHEQEAARGMQEGQNRVFSLSLLHMCMETCLFMHIHNGSCCPASEPGLPPKHAVSAPPPSRSCAIRPSLPRAALLLRALRTSACEHEQRDGEPWSPLHR